MPAKRLIYHYRSGLNGILGLSSIVRSKDELKRGMNISNPSFSRPIWIDFLSNDPKDWRARIGEHHMFEQDTPHMDVPIVKIIRHPKRNRKYIPPAQPFAVSVQGPKVRPGS